MHTDTGNFCLHFLHFFALGANVCKRVQTCANKCKRMNKCKRIQKYAKVCKSNAKSNAKVQTCLRSFAMFAKNVCKKCLPTFPCTFCTFCTLFALFPTRLLSSAFVCILLHFYAIKCNKMQTNAIECNLMQSSARQCIQSAKSAKKCLPNFINLFFHKIFTSLVWIPLPFGKNLRV